jgi:four helix bundle protein
MKTFRDLKVWQKSHELVLEIYKATKNFPREEKFGLISQIRRSASSVPTNIVEGFKRKSDKEFMHFLNLADSSLEETKYHLILSLDLTYISRDEFDKLEQRCNEVGRMLYGLQQSIKNRQ